MARPYDVWMWGNPLLDDNPTYAPYLENHVSYQMLADITRKNFRHTYKVWTEELFRSSVAVDALFEVVKLYIEAHKKQHDPRQYIANRLQCDEQYVQKLFMFLDISELLENPPIFAKLADNEGSKAYYSIGEDLAAPTPTQLSRIMASIRHTCPANFEGCSGEFIGRTIFCSNCYKQLGTDNSSLWTELTQQWLPKMVNTERARWRKEAREVWYAEYAGRVSVRETERLLDAA